MNVRSVDVEGIAVVLCLAFDRHAPSKEVESFKRAFIGSADVTHSLESTGTFDFMVEFNFPDFGHYTDRMKELADPLARLVARYETSFVARRFVPSADRRDDFWIPNRNGMQRVRCRDIEVVHAEGDYVRIQAGGRDYLMNTTMASINQRLESKRFVQLHRSAIVRRDYIDRLSYGEGRWTAHLIDGTTQRIARSLATKVVRSLRDDSSDLIDISTRHVPAGGREGLIMEIASDY